MLDYGADPNQRTRTGYFALYYAAQENNADVINVLLNQQYDCNVDQQSDNGVSALMIAADKNNAAAVTALLDGNADVNLENSYGNTAVVLTTNPAIKSELEAAGAAQLIKFDQNI